jgi:hypothetical protein
MHLNRRLTWAKHIKTKRRQLIQEVKQMHWLLGRGTLSIESELLLYTAVLKPIWTYPIPTPKSPSAFNQILFDPF